ncbi:MAG: T9SS type A sorting domain-containing protein [Balneolaceae bacterium]|nr:T9SS type A sorting domain-containing protein [Balneolaceae bacterium]
MRKLLLVLSAIFLLQSTHILAQSTLQLKIDRQYTNQLYKNYIYQVSPKTKQLNRYHLQVLEQQYLDTRAGLNTAINDTSWRYNESKVGEDSVWHPDNVYYLFSEELEGETSLSYYHEYKFEDDTTMYLAQEQLTRRTGDHTDTTTSLYYHYGEDLPYNGSRFSYPETPSEGADRESIWDAYNGQTNEWERQERTLYYKGEVYDTLTVKYSIDSQTQEEYKSSVRRYIREDNYWLQENRWYLNSGDDIQKYNSWSYQYTKLGEDQRIIYAISKTLNNEQTGLVPQDSLVYDYSVDGVVGGDQYKWEDSLYVLDGIYDTYYSMVNEEQLTDSVIYYYVELNEETNTYEEGEARLKSEFEYDSEGNQIRSTNYSDYGNGLVLTNETINEYDNEGRVIKTIGYNANQGSLVKSYELVYKYDETGWRILSQRLYFDGEGNITNGRRDETATLEHDGYDGYKYFSWDTETGDWLLIRYYANSLDAGESISQVSNYTVTEGGYKTRGINSGVSGKKVAVLNDGPQYINSGDTLLFYISARTMEMGRPTVEIENLPAGASFDAETNRFYWPVDEAVNTTMTVKAYDHRDTSRTTVDFIAGEITVDKEPTDKPLHYTLDQNYPNPFNPTTTISFNLPEAGLVSLKVYNMLGQEVVQLVNERMGAGLKTVQFNASGLSSGMYIYRLKAGSYLETRKMTLIK